MVKGWKKFKETDFQTTFIGNPGGVVAVQRYPAAKGNRWKYLVVTNKSMRARKKPVFSTKKNALNYAKKLMKNW
jgi:hypothetical protein